MLVSQARIEANRRNAQKSTGPRTPEGKEKSRVNALKHGLFRSALVPEDLDAVQTRSESWYQALKPQNAFHFWLVTLISTLSIRIDRSERMERRIRDKISLRAELSWDDDREAEAAKIGSRIARRPDEVVKALRRTPQGCDWLIHRWALLAFAADQNSAWTPDQVKIAFDLLGTPAAFRHGFVPGATIDSEGRIDDDGKDQAAVARRQIAELKERREIVRDLDDVDQALASADLYEANDPELKQLRRHEATLHTRLHWAIDELQKVSPFKGPSPNVIATWSTGPEPRDRFFPEGGLTFPSNSLHPPFNLEPDEIPAPGVPLDVPAIIKSRAQKKAKKTEDNRQAKRRKLERMRA